MDNDINFLNELYLGDELKQKLKVSPDYDRSIRQKSKSERLLALQDMLSVYIPNNMSCEIYSKMYFALIRSMNKKHSIQAVRQYNENYRMLNNQPYQCILGGSDCFTVLAPSGLGKSSAIERAARIICSSPVVEVNSAKLIPCLIVQTPADCSIKSLLLSILLTIDNLIGTTYYPKAINGKIRTTDVLIYSVSQVCLTHVGLLVLDEIQNTVAHKNGQTMINHIVQLINNSGISIAMVGGNYAEAFFKQDIMLSRRSVGLTYDYPEYGDEFKNFCINILRYNYTQKDIVIDEELLLWLYNYSGACIANVVGLIYAAQEIAIMGEEEEINKTTLTAAYKSRLGMMHDFITFPTTKNRLPKQKKITIPQLNEPFDNNISIANIVKTAKQNGSNVICSLTDAGIKVIEVAI